LASDASELGFSGASSSIAGFSTGFYGSPPKIDVFY
jgi:hypothetical protein